VSDDRTIYDFTAEEYRTCIADAIKASDTEGLDSLLRSMAIVHPREAGEVLEEIRLGVRLAAAAVVDGDPREDK